MIKVVFLWFVHFNLFWYNLIFNFCFFCSASIYLTRYYNNYEMQKKQKKKKCTNECEKRFQNVFNYILFPLNIRGILIFFLYDSDAESYNFCLILKYLLWTFIFKKFLLLVWFCGIVWKYGNHLLFMGNFQKKKMGITKWKEKELFLIPYKILWFVCIQISTKCHHTH